MYHIQLENVTIGSHKYIYCKCIIFSVYDIWRFLDCLLFSMDFIWWLIQTFKNAHLTVYLIWWRDSTAKGTKKNTLPNITCLQYYSHCENCLI